MTFENKNLRCRGCRFWWPTGEGAANEPLRERAILGQCRRHAPPPLLPICPITAATIRPGRPPSATTGAATTSIFSNDADRRNKDVS